MNNNIDIIKLLLKYASKYNIVLIISKKDKYELSEIL